MGKTKELIEIKEKIFYKNKSIFIECFCEYLFALLICYKIYATLTGIGNENKQMWFLPPILRIFVGKVVMFMVKVVLFFIIALISSLMLNFALTAVLYKNWVDKQLRK